MAAALEQFQEDANSAASMLWELRQTSYSIECLEAVPRRSLAEEGKLTDLRADQQQLTSGLAQALTKVFQTASAVLGKLQAQPA